MNNNEFTILKPELKNYLTDAQIKTIEEAYLFAKTAHGSQKRYSGELYITHPIAVALILAQMRMDPATIMAAILHDVIEDTLVDKKELAERFGKEVADLVDGVTKLTQIHFEDYLQAQAENFRKMVMAMARDIRVILIKLANRLGMHAFRVELEDLGFAALHPLRYRILKAAVTKAHGNRQEIMEMIDKEIRYALRKFNIPSATLSGREKHLYSIYKKMHEKHLSFSEIMDVYGFRVIVDKMDTCYRILGILHNL